MEIILIRQLVAGKMTKTAIPSPLVKDSAARALLTIFLEASR